MADISIRRRKNRDSREGQELGENAGDQQPGGSDFNSDRKDAHANNENESDGEESDIPGIPDSGDAGADVPTSAIPSGTDVTPEVLDSVTRNMPPRWKNWTVRFVIGALMIFGFVYLLYLGPLALVLLVMCIQLKCFSEIINIGYIVYRSQNLPWFRTLSWYFLFTSNYYIYGETMIDQFGVLLQKTDFLRPLSAYHRFISFSLYLVGFVGFVFSLKKKQYLRQFTLFGYTHVTLLIVAVGSNLIIRNIFEGIFWFFISTSMIICNDIWAYFFGFFLGRTPLIKLSPKKTWEGFIGGGCATILYAIIVSNVMVHYDELVCPLDYNLKKDVLDREACLRNPVFLLAEYTLPKVLQNLSVLLGKHMVTVHLYPITFHAIILALFSSLIGPFGGFFASGFKRAFKIKDFGDIFPGHGGFMDRFDCQVLMGIFVYIYVITFVRIPNPKKLLVTVFAMQPDDQLVFFKELCEGLEMKQLINCTCLGL